MDLVQITWNPPPSNVDWFFLSPLFYNYFPIFRHNFYIKSKKKREKWTLPEPPPPLWIKSIQMFFYLIYLTSLMATYDFSIKSVLS